MSQIYTPTVHTPTSRYELEQLTVRGSSRQMGAQYGAHFKGLIRAFVEMRLSSAERYFKEWGDGGIDALIQMGARCWEVAQGFDPEAAAEQVGIAEAVGVDPALLYAVTNMTDVRDAVVLGAFPPPADDEGCTSALAAPAQSSLAGGVYGQTWDLNPPDIDFIAAIHRVPDQGLETWSVTCVGCLTLVGMNERGVAVGTTNLKTWGSRVGVGYLSVLHKAIAQPTLALASEVFERAPVAGAHSYWAGSPEGGVEWERSSLYAFSRTTQGGALGRSNHCVFETHQRMEGVEVTASSAARKARVDQLMGVGGVSVERMRAIFADRSDGVHSINRYHEDAQGTTTNAVAIADPAARVLHACRGPADRGVWVELSFERPVV